MNSTVEASPHVETPADHAYHADANSPVAPKVSHHFNDAIKFVLRYIANSHVSSVGHATTANNYLAKMEAEDAENGVLPGEPANEGGYPAMNFPVEQKAGFDDFHARLRESVEGVGGKILPHEVPFSTAQAPPPVDEHQNFEPNHVEPLPLPA
jgi:hypothetical protein